MIVSRPRRRVFGKSTVARVPDDAVPNSSRRRIWSKWTVPTVSEHVDPDRAADTELPSSSTQAPTFRPRQGVG